SKDLSARSRIAVNKILMNYTSNIYYGVYYVFKSTKAADVSRSRPWPADRVEHWPVERLIPYTHNPRVHSAADLDRLADAVHQWGWTMPVLVDEQGQTIAGEARRCVAQKLQLSSIPVVVARGWSEAEKRAYRLADNQLAARASFDLDLLRSEL